MNGAPRVVLCTIQMAIWPKVARGLGVRVCWEVSSGPGRCVMI